MRGSSLIYVEVSAGRTGILKAPSDSDDWFRLIVIDQRGIAAMKGFFTSVFSLIKLSFPKRNFEAGAGNCDFPGIKARMLRSAFVHSLPP